MVRLTLSEDRVTAGITTVLSATNRVVYVVSGRVDIDDNNCVEDEAWFGAGAVRIAANEDATLWRWELHGESGQPVDLGNTRHMRDDQVTLPQQDPVAPWLMRCDSVWFPAGGCAYTHTHQGPGIRCLLYGSIRIDTGGVSTTYAPGQAWFESGPEEVFAQADAARPTRFIRVMILPNALLGQSSIQYVRVEDRDKPKVQRYHRYCDSHIIL